MTNRYEIISTSQIIIAEQAFVDTFHAGDYILLGPYEDPNDNTTRYILDGWEWVGTFTETEWAWLKTQRQTSDQLDQLMDAIRWTNSVDVSSASMDGFYNWLLANNIPGGQTRIDELRAGITE